MLAFGVDIPLVELMIFFMIIATLLLIEIIVVVILQLYQMKENKRMMRNSLEVAKVLLEIKERELKLRQIKK
ncbi:hypothetical protein KY306_03205 [Candidatus Woesearchaeota archaeon]|nr:hypothetical protein [Candidatus Woesearchaeota archaeon]